MATFSVRFLGCKVSHADAQAVRDRLLADGHEEREGGADVAVVNTCCVTHEAVSKSRQAVSRAARTHGRVYVTGCAANLRGAVAPSEHVTVVRLSSDEVMSMCPVTKQPDLSSLVLEYRPDGRCIESKSLKLYLWSFRDRAAFCEAMAAEIADEVVRSADPHEVTVTLRQRPRGGIVIEATATRSKGA